MAAHMKISLDPQCAGVPTWTSKWVLQVTVVSLVSPWGNTHCCFICESIGHGWHFHAFPWWSSFNSWRPQLFRYVLTRPRGRGPRGCRGLGPGSDGWGWDQVDNYIPGAASEVGEVGGWDGNHSRFLGMRWMSVVLGHSWWHDNSWQWHCSKMRIMNAHGTLW